MRSSVLLVTFIVGLLLSFVAEANYFTKWDWDGHPTKLYYSFNKPNLSEKEKKVLKAADWDPESLEVLPESQTNMIDKKEVRKAARWWSEKTNWKLVEWDGKCSGPQKLDRF